MTKLWFIPAMTPNENELRAKFVQNRLKHHSDAVICAIMPFGAVGKQGVILLTEVETGEQFWITSEQRDQELIRRAKESGRQA